MADARLSLMENDRATGQLSGAVGYLSEGLNIEIAQYVILIGS